MRLGVRDARPSAFHEFLTDLKRANPNIEVRGLLIATAEAACFPTIVQPDGNTNCGKSAVAKDFANPRPTQQVSDVIAEKPEGDVCGKPQDHEHPQWPFCAELTLLFALLKHPVHPLSAICLASMVSN